MSTTLKNNISYDLKILFTTSSIYEKIYKQITEHLTDCSMTENQMSLNQNKFMLKNLKNMYYFFQNETDYVLIYWFDQAQYTKNDIDQFFENKRFLSLHEHLSFQSADKWMKLLHDISYDIQDQTWKSATFQIKTAIQEAHQKTYLLQYQDIMNMLTFLLEH